MNNKEKTIWYLAMNLKDLIAINYQDKNGKWKDSKMKNYYFTMKSICYEIACRHQEEYEIKKFESELDTDIEAIEHLIEEELKEGDYE